MKKVFIFLSVAALLAACGNNTDNKAAAATDSTASAQPATAAKDTTAAPAAPAVKDSLMQFKGGKVMISLNGNWSELSATITTTNGRKVNPNGDVTKNGKTRKMEEGMMIDKDGQLMDKDGKPLDTTGWE